jgi:hypothetical protein
MEKKSIGPLFRPTTILACAATAHGLAGWPSAVGAGGGAAAGDGGGDPVGIGRRLELGEGTGMAPDMERRAAAQRGGGGERRRGGVLRRRTTGDSHR